MPTIRSQERYLLINQNRLLVKHSTKDRGLALFLFEYVLQVLQNFFLAFPQKLFGGAFARLR